MGSEKRGVQEVVGEVKEEMKGEMKREQLIDLFQIDSVLCALG